MTCTHCHSCETEGPYRRCSACRHKDREYNRNIRGRAYVPSGVQEEKSERILLGLELSRIHLEPGQSRSFHELAKWCECSPQALQKIAHDAIAKVRQRLGSDLLEEALSQLSDGRREAARIEWR